MFEYRAPKDLHKNHDGSPIRLETPGSDIVVVLEGVTHARTYAQGTSCILQLTSKLAGGLCEKHRP